TGTAPSAPTPARSAVYRAASFAVHSEVHGWSDDSFTTRTAPSRSATRVEPGQRVEPVLIEDRDARRLGDVEETVVLAAGALEAGVFLHDRVRRVDGGLGRHRGAVAQ